MSGDLIKKIRANIPVASLAQRLELEPGLWRENTWRQDYVVKIERPVSPQRDTEAVMFRWAHENTIESVRDSLDIKNHQNFHKICELGPLLLTCLTAIGAVECGRVFVTKLKSGGSVIPHCDYGMYSDHFERFHLVISSDEGNQFFVSNASGDSASAEMRPGELYWFNHKETHWAINNSKSARMHLIIDAVAPFYRRERVTV